MAVPSSTGPRREFMQLFWGRLGLLEPEGSHPIGPASGRQQFCYPFHLTPVGLNFISPPWDSNPHSEELRGRAHGWASAHSPSLPQRVLFCSVLQI